MTLSMLALAFLTLERRRLGNKHLHFALCSHDPPVPATTVARLVTRQLVRNEDARRDRWRAKGLCTPNKVAV